MILQAKELLQSKFWLLEENGEKFGTLSLVDNKLMLSDGSKATFFDNTRDLTKKLGKNIIFQKLNITEKIVNEIYGYPTKSTPYNAMFDVHQRLPLYTKSEKSNSYFCAGYYIVQFEKGWLRRDFPKLLTISRNPYKGPYRTKIEQKLALGAANAK